MDAKITGEFILRLRKENNLTQKQLAEKINVTDKAISRWETGKGFPDVSSLLDISELFSVSVNELLIGRRLEQTEIETTAEKNIVEIIEKSDCEKSKSKVKTTVLFVISTICVLMWLIIISNLPEIISHRVQGGYTIVSLSSDTVGISDFDISVTHNSKIVDVKESNFGIYYKSEYGDYHGIAEIVSDNAKINGLSFEFGFNNTNNWHKVTINLFVDVKDDKVIIKQVITYLSDNDLVISEQTQTESSLDDLSDLSVFKYGV